MLAPRKRKYRKERKGRIHGHATQGAEISYGEYGLKALDPGRITARQIEAARRAMTRYMRRAGRVWIRCFPDVPVTSKPAEVRMGKGKGNVDFYVNKVCPGKILFELGGVSEEVAKGAIRLADAKLPIKSRFVRRADRGE